MDKQLAGFNDRFRAKVIAVQERGGRVMTVTFEAHEKTFDCPSCKSVSILPEVNHVTKDTWSSCSRCGQVGIFTLSC